MKKFGSFLVLSLFLVGCSGAPVEMEAPDISKEVKAEKTEVKIEYKDVVDVKDVVLSADSFLVDSTNVGFNYEAGMVMDQDFSTAWCGEKGGKNGELTMDFAGYVEADKVGILPGFGRDENIYSKNNRIKSLGVIFDEGAEQIFDFDDSYRMHFVDLNGEKFKKVKFVIKDVYNGSKYNDTCISEIDFWSDFVASEDSQAAMNYYVKYKKDFALKPYDIVSTVRVTHFDYFKQRTCKDSVYLPEEFYDVFFGIDMHVFAKINEFGKEGDELVVKVFKEEREIFEDDWDNIKSLGWVLTLQEEVEVIKTCEGYLYAYLVLPGDKFIDSYMPMIGNSYKINFYKDEKLVGSKEFSIVQ